MHNDDSHDSSSIEYNFTQAYNDLLKKMNQDHKDQVNELKKLMKQHKVDIKNSHNKKANSGKKKQTGFTKPEVVPDNIAKLLDLDKGSSMPRTEVTKEIYKVIQSKGLHYADDKRVFRADKELKKVFNLPDSVNKSTDPKDKSGFNFYNLQSYIAKCYNDQNNKKVKQKRQVSNKLTHS
jgi:chromatin remodeling complex protein RSC6